ncbi:MAG: response regulator [Myxococcales bacterium]|nr:response regulator [Myxococcales bacterium]
MDAPSTYDFAVLTHATIDFGAIPELLSALQRDFGPQGLRRVELLGRPDRGEVALLYRFGFSAYSSILRKRMEQENQRLKGRLVEMNLLAEGERAKLELRFASYEARAELLPEASLAINDFRGRMGLGAPAAEHPVAQVRYESADEILAAYARHVTEGGLSIPTSRPMPPGTELRVLFIVPGLEPLEAKARVLEVGAGDRPFVKASLEPGEALRAFVAKEALKLRAGRVQTPDGGRRKFERYETCLQVQLRNYPDLLIEYASNISRGGFFARTLQPPPARSRVRLTLELPDGEGVETEAEVVHVVTPEESQATGRPPGVGLSFLTNDPQFDGRIAALIEQYRARKPKVLLVDDDAFFRRVLTDALTEAGMEVVSVSDGHEAMEQLTDLLFRLDLMVLDLNLPGLDGLSLLWRIRKLGGEADLRVVVLSGRPAAELEVLTGPSGANAALSKEAPMEEVVDRIKHLLGR